MERKTTSGIMISLLISGILTLAFNIQPVGASGTVYIRPDGSVDPPTAPIQRDGDLYTCKNNTSGIIVQRSNIVIDGAGYSISGISAFPGSFGVTIKNATIAGGVWLEGGIGVGVGEWYLSENKITDSTYGIFISNSHGNIISKNNITGNKFGVYLFKSWGNSLSGNIIENNTYNLHIAGTKVGDYSSHSIDVSNLVNGKPVYYLIGQENLVIDSTTHPQVGYLALVNCDNITVEDLTLTDNAQGLLLAYTSNSKITNNHLRRNYFAFDLNDSPNNTIYGNNIEDNIWGVFLDVSSYNTISGNNIVNNDRGVHFWSSKNNTISGNNIENNSKGVWIRYWSMNNDVLGNNIKNNDIGLEISWPGNNRIYHNNFINNIQQVSCDSRYANFWDDGSEGNYWSDYMDRYPNATELDGSGIWDTPYIIDKNNQDNYPLMEPWSPFPRTIGELKNKIEEFGLEGKIDNQGIVKNLLAKLNVAQKLVDKGKVNEAKMISEGFIIQVQELSGIHITVETADILIQSAGYILSKL